MNHVKKADIIRKQNEDLLNKVSELQKKIDSMEFVSKEENKKVEMLLLDLGNIKNKWIEIIEDLNNKKVKYENLIYELQEIKGIMKDMNFTIPWYKKMFLKIRKIIKNN